MNEKHNLYLLDEQEESFLQSLFDDAMEQEGQAAFDAQAAGSEELPQVPEALDQKCREIIHSAGKTHKRRAARTCICSAVKRIAVFIAVILPIASVLVMNVDAVKVPVLNYFVENRNLYSSFIFGKKTHGEPVYASTLDQVLSVAPPEGYSLSKRSTAHDGTVLLFFVNQNGSEICISLANSHSIINIDTEDAEIISTKVHDHDATYVKKNGHHIIWTDGKRGAVFDVYATDLSEDEFWKYVFRLAE